MATGKWLKLFKDAKRTRADPLLDGESYYASLIRDIETATSSSHYIYILGWMLDISFQLVADDPDKTMFKLLSSAADRGVEIRILIWDNLIPEYNNLSVDAAKRLNNLPNTKVFLDSQTFFPAASMKILASIAPKAAQLVQRYGNVIDAAGLDENMDIPPTYIKYRLLNLSNQQNVGAHHEKVVIVKGNDGFEEHLVAYCGGLDINKNRVLTSVSKRKTRFNQNPGSKEYRFPSLHDAACRLIGPAAYDVLQKFKLRWANHPAASEESLLGATEPVPAEKPSPYPYAKVVGTYNSVDGSVQDRSLKTAYLTILENARSHIYIEDQYCVNLDVAKVLNKKIKEKGFKKLMFGLQDWRATTDIFIWERKLNEFGLQLFDGTSQDEKDKVLFAVFDRRHWAEEGYHVGMHAKTLIVDDEIAIIGSGNVNQRSFTVDSETSVVVFDETDKVDYNFARTLRVITWKEFMRDATQKKLCESWDNYPAYIARDEPLFSKQVSLLSLVRATYDDPANGTSDVRVEDLDEQVKDRVRETGVIGIAVAAALLNEDLLTTAAIWSEATVERLFNTLWDHIVDPAAP